MSSIAASAAVHRARAAAARDWRELVVAERLRGMPLDPDRHAISRSIPPPGASISRRESPLLAAAVGTAPRRGADRDDPLLLVAAALFGLCIGSFLNVVIYRLPLGQSLATPPSRCRKCGYSLRWFDNIPVLSWVLLRGRCRKCGAACRWQYPLVELITAALFVLVVWLTPAGPLMASRLLLVCILIALFGIDLEHQILPNSITLPGIVIGLLFSLVAPPGWQDALIGVAARRRHPLRDRRRVLPVAA